MRPVLRPGLFVLRRSPSTLQLGLQPDRTVLIADGPPMRAVLAALDGIRSADQVLAAAEATGIDAVAVRSALAALHDCGALVNADNLRSALGTLPAEARAWLTGEVGALAAMAGQARYGADDDHPDAGVLFARRRRASVAIHGLSGSGSVAAWQLAVAGLGALVLVDTGTVPPVPVATGGSPVDRPRPRRSWLRDELHEVAPWTRVRLGPTTSPVDAAVLIADAAEGSWVVDRAVAAAYLRCGVPHLVASVRGTTAELGPFVLPGASACLRCSDLSRAEADPVWPLTLSQPWTTMPPPGAGIPAADGTLRSLVGVWAAAEVFGCIQGLPVATAGATLQITCGRPPQLRQWRVHPACGCDWGEAATIGA